MNEADEERKYPITRAVRVRCARERGESRAWECEARQDPSGGREPPFVRRMFVCAALFLLDICLALWGGDNLYHKRYFIGTALVIAGGLMACIGLGLLWVTRFPSTWDWWL